MCKRAPNFHNSVKLRPRTFRGFPHLDRIGGITTGCVKMTVDSEWAITPRDRFLEAAKIELASFEKKEREFRKADRKERAERLRLPADKSELLN